MDKTKNPIRTISICAFLILLIGSIAYSNSLEGDFLFDDESHILFNPDIRALWPLQKSVFSWHHATRPLMGFSFALNYAMSGYQTWSYHLFNLTLHLLSALCVFGIVRRLCLSRNLVQRFEALSIPIALSTALLWVVHPLNTQAVSYIVQRFQSGMGFFYLLTLYLSIRAMELDPLTATSKRFQILAVVTCALGMGCKQDMVTAPFVIILCDKSFFNGTLKNAILLRWRFYAGLLLTEFILFGLIWTGPSVEWAGFGKLPISSLAYALNQLPIVAHYFWLAVWPAHLTFDYWWTPATTLKEIIPQGLFIIILLGILLWRERKSPFVGFLVAYLLGTLAITSSFFPIADLACEYRMYLPLVAILALGSGILWEQSLRFGGQRGLRVAGFLISGGVIILISLTYARNEVYANALTLWKDTVKVRPGNPRAWNNLGIAYENAGRLGEARESYRKAFEVSPIFPGAQNSMARIALREGRIDDAIILLNEALRVLPKYALTHVHLAKALSMKGKPKEAIQHCRQALEIEPDLIEAKDLLTTLQTSTHKEK